MDDLFIGTLNVNNSFNTWSINVNIEMIKFKVDTRAQANIIRIIYPICSVCVKLYDLDLVLFLKHSPF